MSVWIITMLFSRLQCASPQQYPAAGNHPQARRDPQTGHTVGDLHPAEQPAVRGAVQPGRGHIPGNTMGHPLDDTQVLWQSLGPVAKNIV